MFLRCAVASAVVLLAVRVAAAESVIDATPIVVRVYDAARLRAADLSRALDEAVPILSSASVDVSWVVCGGSGVDRRCATPLRPGELTVRLLRGGIPAAASGPLPLGDAMVDSRGAGVLATVYVDRVQRLAAESRANPATLLGRAIAHELGHLLLSSRVHSKYGLMRSFWSRHEMGRGADADWRFTAQDAGSIRARLAARANPNIGWGTE
jgi:hypothetical protein